MPRNGAKEYTTEEDNLIKSLYPEMDEKAIGEQLGRTEAAITLRRRQLGVYKPNKSSLSDDQIEQVETLLKQEVSVSSICEVIKGVTVPMVYTVRDRMFKRISKDKHQYIEPIKSFIAMGQTAAYWIDEDEIMESFDLKYSIDDKGMEKELAWHMYGTGQTKVIMSKMKANGRKGD